ncbi:MAG: hypothetical protein ACRDZP_00245 [Acidimicrobiales bacterium]
MSGGRREWREGVGGEEGTFLKGLPPHRAGVPWPRIDWPTGEDPAGVDLEPLLEEAFDDEGQTAKTLAVVVVHRGAIVAERYGGTVEHFDRPPEPVGRDSSLLS